MSSDFDDRFDDEPRSERPRFRAAQSSVGLPAILLIVVGAVSLLLAILGLIQRNSVPQQFDQAIAKVDADPNLTRNDKDAQIDMFTKFKELFEQTALPYYIVEIVCSLLVILGGIKMLQLSGPALPTVSAILAMIPCTVGCCCFLGLPVGIWALVVLYRPEVRRAMAARKASVQYPDEDEEETR